MLNEENHQDQVNQIKPYAFSDEVTKRKIKRHLYDINDVITENDIKNVKVPGGEDESTPAMAEKGVVDDAPGNPVTSWDVLDE